jgi:hypothetical protein
MDWLLMSLALVIAVIVVGRRLWRRRTSRQSLCRNCQYDHLDICDDPRRPSAAECETYLAIEEEGWQEE